MCSLRSIRLFLIPSRRRHKLEEHEEHDQQIETIPPLEERLVPLASKQLKQFHWRKYSTLSPAIGSLPLGRQSNNRTFSHDKGKRTHARQSSILAFTRSPPKACKSSALNSVGKLHPKAHVSFSWSVT